MSGDGIKEVLMDFGLTQKEIEIYIFLSKYSPIKAGEIIKRTKTHRALIYRILGSLQKKGLVESTLESPTRFQAVPFEIILDQNIKTKREEATQIENKKTELLDYWKKISQTVSEPSPEKFNVIEGQNRISSKISQMIKETKYQLRITLNLPEFIRIVQLELFETDRKQTNSKVQYQLLTDFTNQNSRALRALLKEIANMKEFFETRIPDLGLGLTPRMLIRDEEEVLFFLSPYHDKSSAEKKETCLCTNSTMLVQSFRDIFEGLWKNSMDLQKKIAEGKSSLIESQPLQSADPESIWKKYIETTNSAKKSILILTFSEGLTDFFVNNSLLKYWSSKHISIRIMAPIDANNFEETQELLKFCEVRHIPNSITRSFTLIDEKYLFQSLRPIQTNEKTSIMPFIGFTDNKEYVKKTEMLLKELWKNAPVPSTVNMKSIRKEASANFSKRADGLTTPLRKLDGHIVIEEKQPSEKDIVNRIITATKHPVTVGSKEAKAYCSIGQAVIHPPRRFSMPDFLLFAHHFEKQSSFGEEDVLIVSLWLDTPIGFSYVPVAVVQNNPKTSGVWKKLYDKTPAGNNVQFVESEDLEIRLHGNTFFAGWNKPIPLCPPKYVLPSGCIILETYGQVLSGSDTLVTPSGFRLKIEGNGFYAFVNFLSSTANYSGPGTDGFVTRDGIMTTTSPSTSNFVD